MVGACSSDCKDRKVFFMYGSEVQYSYSILSNTMSLTDVHAFVGENIAFYFSKAMKGRKAWLATTTPLACKRLI